LTFITQSQCELDIRLRWRVHDQRLDDFFEFLSTYFIAIELHLLLRELKRVRRQLDPSLASLLRVSFLVIPHPSAPLLPAVAVTTTFLAAFHAASAVVI